MNSTDHRQFLAPCCAIAKAAGRLILTHAAGPIETKNKHDNSPVTEADHAANAYIVKELQKLTPDIPVVAEEDEEMPARAPGRFWLVDPLDGTKSFARGEPDYTVNIALIVNHAPVLGVIYAPATDALYWGEKQDGAFRERGGKTEKISARALEGGAVVAKSKSHPSEKFTAFIKQWDVKETIPCGSSIKFCMIAEGSADLYPRLGRTMEWDTGAGQAILEAAGGRVETLDGKPLTYGKPGFENPHFLASGK